MADWLSYELIDFLMFAPETYWRMIELYNNDLWPLHVPITLMLVFAGMMGVSGRRRWILPAVFALCWFMVAVFFFALRYSEIFWAAGYWAWTFALQGALFTAIAVAEREKTTAYCPEARKYSAFIVAAVAALPLIQWGQGASLAHIQLTGLLPDPTALASIVVLFVMRAPWWTYPIPLAWMIFSTLTLYVMEDAYFWVTPAVTSIVITVAVARRPSAAVPHQPHWAR